MPKEVAELIEEVYKTGKATNGILSMVGEMLTDHVKNNFSGITKDFTTPDTEMLARLTRDVWQFSAAKNYQQMRDITLALKDEKGKLREFSGFKDAAEKICEKYDERWLETEYNFAIAASQNAARWNEFEQEKHIIPNLRYQTVGDENVRDSHAVLNGIVKPIDDSFWNTYYPPNGWGCRCEAVQAPGETASPSKDGDTPGIPSTFKTNLAKQGLIYPKNHPYYQGIPKSELRKAIAYLPPENTYSDIALGKHTVSVHPLHGEKELAKNLEAANILLQIDPKAKIKFLPIIEEKDMDAKKLFYPKEYLTKFPNKNADILYNGKAVEIESPNGSKSSIQHAITSGKKQSDFVIIHVPDIQANEANRVIKGHLKHYEGKENLTILVIDNDAQKLEYHIKQKR